MFHNGITKGYSLHCHIIYTGSAWPALKAGSSVDSLCPIELVAFLANVLRYVRYMLSAVRLLSVVCCLSVVCLSVTLVHPTQAVKLFGNFFSPYDSSGTLLFWCQKSLVGDAFFPLKFAFKVTHPFKTAQFRPISAHGASTMISSEKKFN